MRWKHEQGRGVGVSAFQDRNRKSLSQFESGGANRVPGFRTERFSSCDEWHTGCSQQFAERWRLDEAIADRLREDWPSYCPFAKNSWILRSVSPMARE